MPATPRATFTEYQKYMILVRQSFRCKGVSNYTCPLQGRHFDEAGYDIDHIHPLFLGGSNDPTNLQALCPSCHRVKTIAEQRSRSSEASNIRPESPPSAAAAAAPEPQKEPAVQPTKRDAEDACALKLIRDFCRNIGLVVREGELWTAATMAPEKLGFGVFWTKFCAWFEKNAQNYAKNPMYARAARCEIIIRKNLRDRFLPQSNART
jgi:hypothetical protein